MRLRFTPAEASFYGTIRDDGRKARNTLQELLAVGGYTAYGEAAARRRAEVTADSSFRSAVSLAGRAAGCAHVTRIASP